jgi:hypothetical protein
MSSTPPRSTATPRQGFVERTPDPTDRRAVLLRVLERHGTLADAGEGRSRAPW